MVEVSIACGVLIVMDIVCGVVAALRNRELCSSVAREGMYNKIGEVMLLLIGIIANEILGIPPFDTLGISPGIAYLVAAYIAWAELISILENICKINPDLPFAKILMMFNIDVDDGERDDVDLDTAPDK